MNLITKLKDDLERDEELKLMLYPDTEGKLTIGIGRNIEDNGISKEEAYYMLENDVWATVNACKSVFPWFDELTEDRQRVVANMVFNMGMHRFLGFIKMIGALKGGDYETASKEMLDSKWARQVGDRAQRLAELMSPEHPISYEEGGA